MIKNTSQDLKVTELSSILVQNIDTKINKARIKLISMLILSMCKLKTVNYIALSHGFDSNASPESSLRRIQRFMSGFNLSMVVISRLIFVLFPSKENLVLVLDRTNWKFGESNINILMLGVCYKNVAIPVMFKMLNKRSNSNTTERIDLSDYLDCVA